DISVPVLSSVATMAETNRGWRNNLRSTTGLDAMSSAGTNSSSAIHATENHAIAGIRPNAGAASDEMPAPTPRNIVDSSTAPGMSMPPYRWVTLEGTAVSVSTIPTRPSGKPAQNTACQPPSATSNPPSGGPIKPATAWVVTITATDLPVRRRG